MSALRSAADTVTSTVTDVVDEVMQRVPEVMHRVPDVMHRVPEVLPGHHKKSSRLPAMSVKALVVVVLAVVAWKLWNRRQADIIGEPASPEWNPTDVHARAAAS